MYLVACDLSYLLYELSVFDFCKNGVNNTEELVDSDETTLCPSGGQCNGNHQSVVRRLVNGERFPRRTTTTIAGKCKGKGKVVPVLFCN